MSEKSLVIVESPAKSKTLGKYLGKDFTILASFGHVRDLRPKTGAVEPDNNFHMHYELIEKNIKHVDAIVRAVKQVDHLYLATDPDREGEAIAWHLHEILKQKGALKKATVSRVAFYEITKSAVKDAIANPRELSDNLVNAQQTRRGLDYLVGFYLSPLLWKKVRRGLSAGRVQSPALRLIVERQAEIDAFVSREYWSILADVEKAAMPFQGRLIEYDGEKLKQFSIENEAAATNIEETVLKAANGQLTVLTVKKSERKRQPAAPFITSTLQQEASRKLGFSAARTMRIAQQLYEGIDVGEGAEGLITYMRTDSVNLANEAVAEIREFITNKYGAKSLPKSPRVYKTKSKNAQEAHEAIRPTLASREPERIQKKLTPDQYKLYRLIWARTVASQMQYALFDMVSVDMGAGSNKIGIFRANGSVLREPGFLAVYEEGLDDQKQEKQNKDDKDKRLPPLSQGDVVELKKITKNQHFTEPPPKYTEASLVKALEEYGIGRPSTYASIISTLQNREYVELEKKRFTPTDVGVVVNKFLTKYFTQYVDYDFTAKLEDKLDAVSRGEQMMIPLLDEFWKPFIGLIKKIDETVERKDVTHEAIDEACPKCGKPLSIRLGKRGRFIGCTGYPDCDYTRNVDSAEGEEDRPEPEIVPDRKCPKCESELLYRTGKYGKFIGCSSFPDCKFIESLNQPAGTGVTCPKCKKGELMKRRTRYGTFFYACNEYPKCRYAVSHEPINETCPSCKWPVLTLKTTKRSGTQKVCPQKECDFKE